MVLGTLRAGAVLVAGTSMGRVRCLKDAEGRDLKEVGPGFPAEIDGWKDIPAAGEQVLEIDSEKKARVVIKVRESKKQTQKQEEDATIIAAKEQQHLREYKEKLAQKRKMGRFKIRRSGPRKPEIQKGCLLRISDAFLCLGSFYFCRRWFSNVEFNRKKRRRRYFRSHFGHARHLRCRRLPNGTGPLWCRRYNRNGRGIR